MSEHTGSAKHHRHLPRYRAPKVIIDVQSSDWSDTDTDTDLTYRMRSRRKSTDFDQFNLSNSLHSNHSPSSQRHRSRSRLRRRRTMTPPNVRSTASSNSRYTSHPYIGGEAVSYAQRQPHRYATYLGGMPPHSNAGPHQGNGHATHPVSDHVSPPFATDSANLPYVNVYSHENDCYLHSRQHPRRGPPLDSRRGPSSSSIEDEVEQLRREVMEFKIAQIASQARGEHIKKEREQRMEEEDAARKEAAAASKEAAVAQEKERKKMYKKLKQKVEHEIRHEMERKYRRKRQTRSRKSQPDAGNDALEREVRRVLEQQRSQEARKMERMEQMLGAIVEHIDQPRLQRGDQRSWSGGRGTGGPWGLHWKRLESEPRNLEQGPDIGLRAHIEDLVLDVLQRVQAGHGSHPLLEGPYGSDKYPSTDRYRYPGTAPYHNHSKERATDTVSRGTRSFSSQTLVNRDDTPESSVVESPRPYSKDRRRRKPPKRSDTQRPYRPQQPRANRNRAQDRPLISEDSSDTQTESDELYLTPIDGYSSSSADEKEKTPQRKRQPRDRGKPPKKKTKKPTSRPAMAASARRRQRRKTAPYVRDHSKHESSEDGSSEDTSSAEDSSSEPDDEDSFLTHSSSRYAFGPRKQRKGNASVPPEAPKSPFVGA